MNDNTETLVVLQEFDSPTMAYIAKSILDCADVFCVLHDEYVSTIYPTGSFPVKLMVRAEDLECAERLLTNKE